MPPVVLPGAPLAGGVVVVVMIVVDEVLDVSLPVAGLLRLQPAAVIATANTVAANNAVCLCIFCPREV